MPGSLNARVLPLTLYSDQFLGTHRVKCCAGHFGDEVGLIAPFCSVEMKEVKCRDISCSWACATRSQGFKVMSPDLKLALIPVPVLPLTVFAILT